MRVSAVLEKLYKCKVLGFKLYETGLETIWYSKVQFTQTQICITAMAICEMTAKKQAVTMLDQAAGTTALMSTMQKCKRLLGRFSIRLFISFISF